MNEFIKECLKISALSEMDGLVEHFSNPKFNMANTNNNFLDKLLYNTFIYNYIPLWFKK